jgi:hypothetical protein
MRLDGTDLKGRFNVRGHGRDADLLRAIASFA